jgi:ABC-type branched-subunit amino acid transport system ATPase component
VIPASLPAALRACARGLYAAEAAVGMLIAHAAWLDRDDFSQFIHADPAAEMAAIDWTAAVTALTAGELPSSSGEQKMLRIAASIAGQAPVILGDAITGLDDRNIQILLKAILHASGQRQFPPVP